MEDYRECDACKELQLYPDMFMRCMGKSKGPPKERKTCNACAVKHRIYWRKRKAARDLAVMEKQMGRPFRPNEVPPRIGGFDTPLLIMAAMQKFRCPNCLMCMPLSSLKGQVIDATSPEKVIAVCQKCLTPCEKLTDQERVCFRNLHIGFSAMMDTADNFFGQIAAILTSQPTSATPVE